MNLDEKRILKLMTLCFLKPNIKFREKFYRQIDGVPMGSPGSPAVSEYFLQNLENKFILQNLDIKFYCRYVDDVFLVVKSDVRK